MRVLVVIGTRPEAIKLWPVISELRRTGVATIVCTTGQHRDLLAQTLPQLGLSPEMALSLIDPGQPPVTAAALATPHLKAVVEDVDPDCVVVQGDTTSALAAARGAREANVRLAHVEAGLRTFDPHAPWPEELNRCEITRLADLHFAPTPLAARNLRADGVPAEAIAVTGNTVVDALQTMLATLATSGALEASVRRELASLPENKRLIFVTAHRRENVGSGLADLAKSLAVLAARSDVEIVVAAHPNPATRSFASSLHGLPSITLLAPLSYPACLALMKRAALLITDSGGLQEEAPSLGLPMLVTRRSTERPEALDCGAGRLVGMTAVAREAGALLDDPVAYRAMAQIRQPFGDGRAASRIVERLTKDSGVLRSKSNHLSASFS